MDRAAELKGCQSDVIFQGVTWSHLENLVTQALHKIFLFIKVDNFGTFRAVHNEDDVYEANRGPEVIFPCKWIRFWSFLSLSIHCLIQKSWQKQEAEGKIAVPHYGRW